MTNTFHVGLSRTPALDELARKWPAEPATTAKRIAEGASRLGDTLRRRQRPFVAAFEAALRSDLILNYPLRDRDQITRLEQAALDASFPERQLADVRPEDVPAVKQRLDSLPGRVRILRNAAISGITELLKQKAPVPPEEVTAAIRLGLNLGLPESRHREERLDDIDDKARPRGTSDSKEYMDAARNFLRRQVQEHEIGDAIMAEFAGLGRKNEVVPFVLQRLHIWRVKKGLTLIEEPPEAGTMYDGAIRDLEQALDDSDFRNDVQGAMARARLVERNPKEAAELKENLDELV